jgi:tetraacyldisaccharide 4'-kinase
VNAPRILLVSNGFGEVAILECIARAIAHAAPSAALAHLRLVGRAGPDAWPPPVGPQAEMPSGGLVTYWNFRNIWRDVRAGLLGMTFRQWAFLGREHERFDAVVAVGDVYCLASCLLFARLPAIFVATAKSEYVAAHSALERWIARRARVTFARDAATAEALARGGVTARYAGNVMMDCVADVETVLPANPAALTFAVLLGSRGDAPENAAAAARRLRLIAAAAGTPVNAYLALAPSADEKTIAASLASAGIAVAATGSSTGVVARGGSDGLDVQLVRGGVGDVLRAADIVLGQAGTGNEQAAGIGKPVVAAAEPGRSPDQVGWYRMRQKRLLGDALLVLPAEDEAFAQGVLALAHDRPRMAEMGTAGRARMGGTGGAAAIADAVLAIVEERT